MDDMDDSYDLWVDFASMTDDGILWSQASNLRAGRAFPGDIVMVGSEDAMPAHARVVSVEDGAILVKVIGVPTRTSGSGGV